jgi:hypothetical protein
MNTIGELIEETIDLADRGLFENSFLHCCETLRETSEKLYDGEETIEPKISRFIRENWKIISLMALPNDVKIPVDVPFEIRRSVPGYSSADSKEELVVYAARQTLAMRRMPIALGFNKLREIVVVEEKLLLPKSLIFGLIAAVIVNPINKNEKINDKYWINIWDFKMFISELWGRGDLVKRIINLYFPDN